MVWFGLVGVAWLGLAWPGLVERERDRDRQTDRQTDRDRERQRDRDRDRQTKRSRDRQTYRQTCHKGEHSVDVAAQANNSRLGGVPVIGHAASAQCQHVHCQSHALHRPRGLEIGWNAIDTSMNTLHSGWMSGWMDG